MDKKDKLAILKSNPQTDRKVVQSYERLASDLKKIGVDAQSSKYSLEPPLGDSPIPSPSKVQSISKRSIRPNESKSKG